MPKALRGRAFAINQAIAFLAAPVGTFLGLATRAAPSIWHLGLAHCGAGAGDRRASRLVDPSRSARIAALARPAWQGGRSRKGDGRQSGFLPPKGSKSLG
jgi:hypothetical protein